MKVTAASRRSLAAREGLQRGPVVARGRTTAIALAVLVAVYESLARRHRILAAMAVLCGLAVPWAAGMACFGLGVGEAYGGLLLSIPSIAGATGACVVALYLWFPAVLAVAALQARFHGRRAEGASDAADSSGRKTPRIPARETLKRWLPVAVVLMAAGAAGWCSLDYKNKIMLFEDYYSQRQMWPEVLAVARRSPYGLYNSRCNRNVMLALYHTGRLGDEMFRYPQVPGRSLYSTPAAERDPHTYFQESRLLLELGQVNWAERCACEAFETSDDSPAILELLAVINIVKGRPETAKMFLTALGRKPFYERSARDMIQRLDEDPTLAGDPRIRQLRRSMVSVDSIFPGNVERFLVALLQANPRNEMALEFLMAHYLCSRSHEKVAAWLSQLPQNGAPGLPRHLQEAIIVNSLATTGQIPAADRRLDPEIVDRARRFRQILAAFRDNTELAREVAIAEGFGDSYFFYVTFGVSGL